MLLRGYEFMIFTISEKNFNLSEKSSGFQHPHKGTALNWQIFQKNRELILKNYFNIPIKVSNLGD